MIYNVNRDYAGRIKRIYMYEWRDNPDHREIQTENSPVHACFRLCYVDGAPKFDLPKLPSVLTSLQIFETMYVPQPSCGGVLARATKRNAWSSTQVPS